MDIFLNRKIIRIGKKFKFFSQILKFAKSICASQGRILDQDMLRQVITLAFLFKKLKSTFFTLGENNKGGLTIVELSLNYDFILKINSRLVMARPIIIKKGFIFDVFHS